MKPRLDEVHHAGDHGERQRDGHEHNVESIHPVAPQQCQRKQCRGDGKELEDGLELATSRSRDDALAQNGEAEDRDAHLAQENDDRDPPGQFAGEREADERAAGKHLVCDRVENLAEVCDEVVATSDKAIDAIRCHADDEQRRRPPSSGV